MGDPLKVQAGGNHYKGMVIQPFELSMANNHDSLTHVMIKYTHRHADKNGYEDLMKARHCCQLRSVLSDHTPPALMVIPIETYIRENGIEEPEAIVMRSVDLLATQRFEIPPLAMHAKVINQIDKLIRVRYPDGK